MSKKLILFMVLACCLTLLFTACSNQEDLATPEEDSQETADETTSFDSYEYYEWEWVLCAALTHARTPYFQSFADAVYERTEGHVDITLIGLGEHPYAAAEFLSVADQGLVEMCDPSGSSGLGEWPSFAVATLPFLIPDNEAYAVAIEAAKSVMFEELESRYGLIALTVTPETPQVLAGKNDPLTDLASMAGKKYRGQNSFGMDILTAVGGYPVNVSYAELASALSTGVIDTFNTGTNSISSGALYDLCDWVSRYPLNYSCASMVINKEAWDSLPVEFQTIMQEEAAALEETMWADLNSWDEEAYQVIIDGDCPVLDYDPAFMQTAYQFTLEQGYYDQWTSDNGEWLTKSYQAVVEALY